jgi:hypothetical protein
MEWNGIRSLALGLSLDRPGSWINEKFLYKLFSTAIKEFQYSFVRSGNVTDWINYLSDFLFWIVVMNVFWEMDGMVWYDMVGQDRTMGWECMFLEMERFLAVSVWWVTVLCLWYSTYRLCCMYAMQYYAKVYGMLRLSCTRSTLCLALGLVEVQSREKAMRAGVRPVFRIPTATWINFVPSYTTVPYAALNAILSEAQSCSK